MTHQGAGQPMGNSGYPFTPTHPGTSGSFELGGHIMGTIGGSCVDNNQR
jgi:hypothetical protein